MRSLPTNSPTNVAALDERDPNAGNTSHVYGVQYGGPADVLRINFQHGPRGTSEIHSGIFDDDLLAILEDRLIGYQSGPFACPETDTALAGVRSARAALGVRVARRIEKGILGVNEKH